MAQTRYEQTPEGDAAPQMSGQRARQGQNVSGMVWVLILGTAFVVLAYTVMITLNSQPVNPENRPAVEATEATPIVPPPLAVPETPSR